MLDVLKSIILDFQEMNLETGVPRRLQIETIDGKATVCIGVRRSGKSTYMFQIVDRLLRSGVSRKNILYINFFDDRLRDILRSNISMIIDAYYSLYPEKKGTETVYCFFDEIQAASGWEPFVDRLLRTEKCEVYLTGSSARMLSKEIATQMRGRALSWEMFPFSFHEYLDFKGIDVGGAFSTSKRHHVQKAFEEYWETGGFPEVLGINRNMRIRVHQEYFQTILYRDIVERHDIPHPKALIDLAHWLVENAASQYSINKLTGYLKALGYNVPKTSVAQYIEWLEDSFFLFTVNLYDASLARRNTNPKRIYCVDHALVSSIASGILVNSGHLLENLVFAALRRQYANIFYLKTKTGREVDFVIPQKGKKPLLVQVSESLADPQTRKREVTALTDAMSEFGQSLGVIVTRNDEEKVETDAGVIAILPAWRYLLDLSNQPDLL